MITPNRSMGTFYFLSNKLHGTFNLFSDVMYGPHTVCPICEMTTHLLKPISILFMAAGCPSTHVTLVVLTAVKYHWI